MNKFNGIYDIFLCLFKYKSTRHYLLPFILILLAMSSCSEGSFSGFTYDPEGAAVTTDKPVEKQKKRTIGLERGGIRVSNEFPGARASDVYLENKILVIDIAPERRPMLNSPWYAFKILGRETAKYPLELRYTAGTHRYRPKVSIDGENWETLDIGTPPADTSHFRFHLEGAPQHDTLWVAAQELITSHDRRNWIQHLREKYHHVFINTAGKTAHARDIPHVIISDTTVQKSMKGVLILLGRQHPAELPGDLAMEAFTESIPGSDSLSAAFLERFEVHLFPMLNPDGVDLGHWRTNANGVDLNRDWKAFNQPETQAVRDVLLKLKKDTSRRVFYHVDFHATDEHVLYPILPEIEKFPGNLTEEWLKRIKQEVTEYPFRAEPFDTTAPIAKNWMFKTFGADGVTFEVYDETNREVIERLGKRSSRLLMELLIEAHDQHY